MKEDITKPTEEAKAKEAPVKEAPVKKKPTKKEKKTLLDAGFYKGYDVRWLRGLDGEHPDFHLVAEYDKKYNK